MKILLINKFFFPFGGTETAFFQAAKLLRDRGHEVIYFSMVHPRNLKSRQSPLFVSQIDFEEMRKWRERIQGAKRILFGNESREKLDRLLRIERPDIAHLHNVYHHLSPAIVSTLKAHGIPVVMTLHDYKVVCPAYRLFNRDKPCERCRGGNFAWCFLKKCVKNSYFKSLICSLELPLHRTYYNQIDRFICPSRFLIRKIQEMGFKGKCVYLPNFTVLSPSEQPDPSPEPQILFFGRLVAEKGVSVLIEAMKGIPADCLVIGDGPLKKVLQTQARQTPGSRIRFLGQLPFSDLKAIIRRSTMVVLPSIWYENNPFTVIESFALGVPVVASRIGGIPELVRDNETGLTFTPGDNGDLKAKIRFLLDHPEESIRLGRKARQWLENQDGEENHYNRLIAIYRHLTSKTHRHPPYS